MILRCKIDINGLIILGNYKVYKLYYIQNLQNIKIKDYIIYTSLDSFCSYCNFNSKIITRGFLFNTFILYS